MSTIAQERVWSKYQTAIYDFVEHGEGSAVIEAVAGSGKTTTLVEAAKRLPIDVSACYLAFNKSIADELKRRLPSHIPALTFNALGHRGWKGYVGHFPEVEAYKVTALVREMSDDSNQDYRDGVKTLVGLAKASGLVPEMALDAYPDLTTLTHDTTDNWLRLIEEFDVDFGWGSSGRHEKAIELARAVLAKSISMGGEKIDFNDQLYLPVIFGADFPTYDYLFVDEAQDVNGIQEVIIGKCLAKNARLIACGDDNQAIYHFRGAGGGSLARLKDAYRARAFPLSVSYRCPQSIVRKAQEYVKHIRWAEGAAEGVVTKLADWDGSLFRPTDTIICRNNAPLIKTAFRLIREKVPCRVLGREIGKGLTALVKKVGGLSVADVRVRLREYLQKEAGKKDKRPDKLAALQDKVLTIEIFADELAGTDTAAALVGKIDGLFSEKNETGTMLTLSTIHKMKGGEGDRIFFLNSHLLPAPWAEGAQRQAETNLMYVGVTRAKKELIFIEG